MEAEQADYFPLSSALLGGKTIPVSTDHSWSFIELLRFYLFHSEKWCARWSVSMDIQEFDSHLLPEGATPLHIAANNKDTSILSSLLLDSRPHLLQDVINKQDSHGRTPLCVALLFGRTEAAALLIQEGADLNVQSSNACDTSLMEVLEKPVYQPLLRMLVNDGVKLAADAPFLRTLLHVAVQEKDENLLHLLLKNYEVEVDCRDHLGSSALHYASLAGHNSMTHLLLKYGASMTLQDSMGRTALHIACARGHVNLLYQFLRSDLAAPEPDQVLNLLDLSGRTCAHVALYCKQYEVLGYLLNHFEKYLDFEARDSNGHTLPGLLYYFRLKLDAIPRSVWLSLPLLSIEESTWALHHAVNRGDMTLLQHSLASGRAEVNTFDFMHLTPLMWASRLGHKEICISLVEAGVNVNLADNLGFTALQYACNNNQFHIAEYLLSLQDTDPIPFFDSFSKPLSLHLLEIILSYFATAVPAQKPAHWQKWLSLAARNPQMTRTEFSKLVDAICPHDWIQQLANGNYTYSPACCNEQKRLYLPSYIEEWTENHVERSSKSAALEAFNRMKSRITRSPIKLKKSLLPTRAFYQAPWRAEKPESAAHGKNRSNCYILMNFKKMTSKGYSKKPRHLGKYCIDDDKSTVVYYPVHEAALYGNSSVLEFIFERAKAESSNILTQLMFEVSDECKRSVVELMAKQISKFAQRLDGSVVDEVKKRNKFDLPESMSYMQAVMHYLIVSNEPDVVVHHSSKDDNVTSFLQDIYAFTIPSQTPLDKWWVWLSYCLD